MVAQLDANDLRALFEHVWDGVLFSRPDGSVVAANPAACSLLRGTQSQIIAAGRAGLTDASDPRWPALIAERERSGSAQGRVRMRRLDGTTFECEVSSSIFTTDYGQQSACVVLRDLSSEQRLIAELLRAERQWRLTVQNAATGIALVGLDGRWLHVNPALCRMVGYSEPELLNRTFQDITAPEDLDADLDLLHQVIAGTIDDYTLDKRYIHRNGNIVWVRLHVSLVRDEHDEPLHFVSQIVDVTEEHAQQTLLERLASSDPLTGLANRKALFSALATVAPDKPFALAFIDLDDFKNVNDNLGHVAGDELLVTVADRMLAEVRPNDLVARFGGDEFAVLLDGVESADVLAVFAQRLLNSLAAPYNLHGTSLTITASVGIAHATGARDAVALLAAADAAMYEAKGSGKNAFRVVR